MTVPLEVCTIIARNYWAHARVLARSLHQQHPDAHLTVLVVDPDEDTRALASREEFDALTPSDIGLDRREFNRMAVSYELLELATALKPRLLQHLVDRVGGPVIYLDPDIELYGPIDEAASLAAEHGIVLTPHTVDPLPHDDLERTELTILQSGVYNLGFIAVSASAQPFLSWWDERLRRECLDEKVDGMFVDQRWIDLAASIFEPHVLRSSDWNLAYWNYPSRQLSFADGRWVVDGEPLRFFHFSGFDADRPDLLSAYQGPEPRVRLEDEPLLARLCEEYAHRLHNAGFYAYSRIPYGHRETPLGLPLDRLIRRLYRADLVSAERRGRQEPPNPFEPDQAESFEDWLNEPLGPFGVTHYIEALYRSRPDLHNVFTEIEGPKGSMFVDWVRAERAAPAQLIPGEAVRPVDGVNVAGYVKAESGVGEVARALVASLDAIAAPHVVVPYTQTASRQESEAVDARIGEPVHATNIVCVNADQTTQFFDQAGLAFTQDCYTVSLWAWEVERFPEWMADASVHADEIWTISAHAARAVRNETSKPVFAYPLPVVRPSVVPASRAALGLPEGFLFLFSFDFDSVFERKNPLAVVDAFARAVAPGQGPKLVVKSVRGDAHRDELARLREAAARHADITVVDGYVSRETYLQMVASCDAYVSLHRAEGFGLTMAEAMALGKPVVATGYSGNLEFMDETNAYLVPYTLVAVGEGSDPYPPGARWAEPDVEAAAQTLRAIVNDPGAARERGGRAAADIARLHSPGARGPFLRERFAAAAEIFRRRIEEEHHLQHLWTPTDVASALVESGPVYDSPTRFGRLSKAYRRLVMRVLRHYGEHQDKIQTSLVESIRELEERLAVETRTTRALEGYVRELVGKLEDAPPALATEAELAPVVPIRKAVDRREAYAELLAGRSPVLYVSCGDAEMLDYLRERGVDALAVELEPSDVYRTDYLEAIGDGTLAAILSARVVERMEPNDLWRFLELSKQKLVASGLLVAETINPPAIAAPKRTEVGELHAISPETLVALCRLIGFDSAYALFGGAADRSGRLDAERRAHMEYAVVAQSSR